MPTWPPPFNNCLGASVLISLEKVPAQPVASLFRAPGYKPEAAAQQATPGEASALLPWCEGPIVAASPMLQLPLPVIALLFPCICGTAASCVWAAASPQPDASNTHRVFQLQPGHPPPLPSCLGWLGAAGSVWSQRALPTAGGSGDSCTNPHGRVAVSASSGWALLSTQSHAERTCAQRDWLWFGQSQSSRNAWAFQAVDTVLIT